MNDALFAAASGMSAVTLRLEMAAKNAANIQTPGYLSRRLTNQSFRSALDRELGREASLVRTTVTTSFAQGNVVRSDAPLDVALRGPGFLGVQGPDGTHYTRNGNLGLAADGTLVTQAGYPVLGETGPIRADVASPGSVRIGGEGRVYQGETELGRLSVTEFDARERLVRTGETLFMAPGAAGARPATETNVVAGHVELPPEKAMAATVAMIEASRNYEAQQRVIRTIGQTYEQLIRSSS